MVGQTKVLLLQAKQRYWEPYGCVSHGMCSQLSGHRPLRDILFQSCCTLHLLALLWSHITLSLQRLLGLHVWMSALLCLSAERLLMAVMLVSLACRCHALQQGKDGKSQSLAKKQKNHREGSRKKCIRLILHLFLLMDYAFVLTGYLRFNIQI